MQILDFWGNLTFEALKSTSLFFTIKIFNKMKKVFLKLAIPALFFFGVCAAFAFAIRQWDDCDGCEYETKFDHTINQGDDSVYNLYCRKSGNSYTIYQRKNEKWERQGSDKQFEKCELVKFMCDCNK